MKGTAKHRRWRYRLLHGPVWFLTWILGSCLVAAFLLAQGPIAMPGVVRDLVADRLNRIARTAGLEAEFGELSLAFRDGLVPVAVVSDVRLRDAAGTQRAALSRAEIVFDRGNLLAGRGAAASARLSGVELSVSRDAEGRLSLTLGDKVVVGRASTPGAMIENLRRYLDAPVLASLTQLGVENVSITYEDAVEGRTITTRSGYLQLARQQDRLSLSVDLGRISSGGGKPSDGQASLDIVSPGPDSPTDVTLALRGLVPAELAGIGGTSPISELLGRLDAPVAMDLTGQIPVNGYLAEVHGGISVGDGYVTLPGRPQMMALDWARASLRYVADTNVLTLDDVSIRSSVFAAEGRLTGTIPSGDTEHAVLQARFENLRLAPPGILEQPAEFGLAAADVRYARTTGEVEIDGILLRSGAGTVTGSARILPEPGTVAVDLHAEALDAKGIVPLWPASLAGRTRAWLGRNLLDGQLQNISAAIRARRGQRPEIGLSFDFEEAMLRPLRGLEPLTAASGRAEIVEGGFRLAVDRAVMADPLGGDIDVTNVIVAKRDIHQKGGELEISFDAEAETGGVLALVQLPVLRPQMADAEPAPNQPLTPQNATGRLDLEVSLDVPLQENVTPADVDYAASGTLAGFTSSTLLPGKMIEAGTLVVRADPGLLEVSGPVQIAGHPVEATFTRPLGSQAADPRVQASGPLTAGLLSEFGVEVPGVQLSGQGRFNADVDLPTGAPPEIAVSGDLAGLAISAGSLGWAKAAGAAGSAEIRGRTGPDGRIDRLSISAPGLEIAGSLDLAPAGVGQITLDRLAVGRWLDTSLRVRPGEGLVLQGGMLDLRHRPQGVGGGNGGTLPEMSVRFDRVHLTDTITVTDVEGRVTGAGGRLTGLVAGRAPVRLDISGSGSEMALRLTSDDAGQVLRAADILHQGRGGALDLRLVPEGPPGHYRGQMRITDAALRDTPVLAELLSAVSVVGALEQLAGEGIVFDDVRADFRLAPARLVIDSASAAGASLGISLDGVVDLSSGAIDLQGAVSPVYFLNRAGSFMTRRGEGLIGISYRLTGSTAAPQLQVNPLSVFVPGFLRDIFRTPRGGTAQ